ncbi:unnamed protein product [Closterium sp. Naga37s-1]|nr:unnamed protein product [Closterium sp. Naga37s-1]
MRGKHLYSGGAAAASDGGGGGRASDLPLCGAQGAAASDVQPGAVWDNGGEEVRDREAGEGPTASDVQPGAVWDDGGAEGTAAGDVQPGYQGLYGTSGERSSPFPPVSLPSPPIHSHSPAVGWLSAALDNPICAFPPRHLKHSRPALSLPLPPSFSSPRRPPPPPFPRYSHSPIQGWLYSALDTLICAFPPRHLKHSLPPAVPPSSPLTYPAPTQSFPTASHSPQQGWLASALDNLIRAFLPRHLKHHSPQQGWLASALDNLIRAFLPRHLKHHSPQQGWLASALDNLIRAFLPRHLKHHSPQQGWLASALDNLVRAFPPRHLKQWRVPGQSESAVVAEPYWLINLGLPRGSLATWASCDGATFLQSLPDDMDLVIAELALSDQGEAKGQGPASFLQMYDTILQHLLLRWGGGSPQTPPQMRQGREGKEGGLDGVKAVAGAAVVLVNFFSFCRGNRACREAEDPSLSFSDVGPFSFGLPPHHPAYPHSAPETVSEDNITVLAQYYSLPVLSTRDAFYTLLGQQASGYRLKDIATTGPSNLPLHVEPDSLASAIPPAAVAPDTADDSYGTAAGGGAGSGPADSIDPVDPVEPLALAGALPTAEQARTKYADVITALFHSALTGKSACSQHLSIMAFESDLKVTALTDMRLKSTQTTTQPPSCPPCCAPRHPSSPAGSTPLPPPPSTPSPIDLPNYLPFTRTCLMDRLTEIHEENDTLSLLPCLLRPPPPFFSRWIHSVTAPAFHPLKTTHSPSCPSCCALPPPFFSRWLHSTAASAFLRPALPHACFSFRPSAVAPPVLGLQGFALQGGGSVHGTEGSGRPGLVAQDDGEWCRAVVSGKEARVLV